MAVSVYEQKLKDAESVISDHNQHLAEGEKLQWSSILGKIKSYGGTSVETLREMTWEDLQDCGIPRVLARRIANQIFRKREDAAPKPLKPGKVLGLTFEQLFEQYDPFGERNPAVTERLEKESKGARCVVFNRDGSVNAVESAQLLRDLKDDCPERETVSTNEGMLRVYRVGEGPNRFRDENPLYPGESLRRGVCEHTNRSWDSVPLTVRQIVYLAVSQTEELVISDIEDAHRVLDVLSGEDVVAKVEARYPQAALKLRDLEDVGQSPTLKIRRGQKRRTRPSSNDPFYGGKGHIRT